MKKYDFYIAISLILISLLFFAWNAFQNNESRLVEIYVDGKIYKKVPLKAEEQTIEIETENGHNTLVVYHDGIKMTEADCPTQTCVHTKKQTVSNSVIACMPHKILVKLIGRSHKSSEVDIIAD